MLQHGPQTIARWASVWTGAAASLLTAKLWTAAVMVPLDCGEKPLEPGQLPASPPERKLRPIALSEPLLKVVESVTIHEEMPAIMARCEPHNLGVGSPDGAAVIVRAVRAEAAWMVEHNQQAMSAADHGGLQAIMPIDLDNAYGRTHRTHALRATQRTAPRLAAVMSSQWQANETFLWMREGARWVRRPTARGGWQGSRAMQICFCLGVEEALSEPGVVPPDARRMGLQDD